MLPIVVIVLWLAGVMALVLRIVFEDVWWES